ncbi:MAG TPA: hypothetical protein DIU00_13165 [Phycisphaerales bacterium]|nr:hypothetical protein [Phycisphaerales bacterium]
MALSKPADRLNKKQDLVHIVILSAIVLAIGIYLIAMTILVSKDGTFYIERAQRFSSDPIGIIKRHHIGYPFLIFIAHKLITFFSDGSSVQMWIYSAQSIALIIGTAICLPKLLARPGSDKPGIRTAAAWLRENTAQEDLIAVTDRRISFYARRRGTIYDANPRREGMARHTKPHNKAKYIVTIENDEDEVPDFVRNAQKQYSVWENERKKNKKIVIYKKTS